MAKREIVEVDEEYMKAIMACDIPRIKIARALAAEREATQENVEESKEEVPETITEQPLTVNQLFDQAEPKKNRNKKEIDFESIFLVKRANIPRRQSYMSQDVYAQVSKYLRVIANDLTVTAYIDNVMRHHMEQYKEEINKLYEKNTQKPF